MIKKNSTSIIELNDVMIYRPTSFTDIQEIIDSLINRNAVGVSFEKASADQTQRFLDFLSGAIYSINGTVKQLSSKEFIFVPLGLEVVVPY